MGMADTLARWLSPVDQKALTIDRTVLPEGVSGIFDSAKVHSGVEVTQSGAMRQVAVYSAVNLIAQSISSLPRKFLLSTDENKTAQQPRQFKALWDRPNPYQSALTFWETMITSLLLWGNAYAACRYNNAGDLIELWPIDPDRVDVKIWDDGTVDFIIARHGVETNKPGDKNPPILFIAGLTMPGQAKGLSPIGQAMEAVGLGIAIERTAAGFFGHGMKFSGYVKVDKDMNRDQAKEMASQMRELYGGAENAGKWAVIGNGATLNTLQVPPQEAQFIEQQRYTDSKIWALYRVPPHLVGDISKSTSWGTGIEEQTIGFVTFTLISWIRKIEEAVGATFLGGTDYKLEFVVQALMRGSMEARYRAYAIGRAGGWLSVNMILRFEGLPSIGPEGDVFLAATQMQNLTALVAASAAATAPAAVPVADAEDDPGVAA